MLHTAKCKNSVKVKSCLHPACLLPAIVTLSVPSSDIANVRWRKGAGLLRLKQTFVSRMSQDSFLRFVESAQESTNLKYPVYYQRMRNARKKIEIN